MGQSNSAPEHHDVPIEQVSHEMALRFAAKCYSHLEITHFKDNFKTLADHQDDVEYWKEETLCRFLSIPSSLHAGPVVFQMATYLGCFPFPSLAPCILTREAMLKVVTILTGKYRKILKRGDQDKAKLLFRSMAVFDRRLSTLSPTAEKAQADMPGAVQESADIKNEARSHATGFAVDEAIDDDEEEDDDELALAALDALDAIEVFREDQKKERKIRRAHIPASNLQKLLMLILMFAPATPKDNLASFSESLNTDRIQNLAESATAILNAFDVEYFGDTVQYAKFVQRLPLTLPYLFRPLSPMFEHFLFSKNIDLSKKSAVPMEPAVERESPIRLSTDDPAPAILNDTLLAQLSMSLEIGPTTSDASSNLFHCGANFSPLYSTASHGTSMSSFSRQVLSWRASTIFLVSGTTDDNKSIILGAYLPDQWKEKSAPPSHLTTASNKDSPSAKAAMFQLRPRHAIFQANPYNKTTPLSHFASKTGISLGCVLPAQSRVQDPQDPILGPVSLTIDADFARGVFQHDPDAGTGAFLTDPGLEEAQKPVHSAAKTYQPKKIEFDVDAVEVWGVSFVGSGEDEIANQKKRLAWEEAEAERRRAVNFGGDKDGARALLEMAGLVGDDAHNRSGGSV